MSASSPPSSAPVAIPFVDHAHQRDAVTLGMWVFLATEVLFFGGMFLAYTVYRLGSPEAFRAASNHTFLLAGTINTAILIVSSFVMVLGVAAAKARRPTATAAFLALTAALGAAFLVLKGFEYRHEIHEGLFPGAAFHIEGVDLHPARMFFYLYFLMTGVHALHVTIGVVLLGLLGLRVLVSANADRFINSVDMLGLYWHFVDLVWVFLFPLLYLIGRST